MLRLCMTLLLAFPAAAQTPGEASGTVARLVMAWSVHAEGLRREDAVLVLTAIRMARGIGQRAATGWSGDALDPPAESGTPETGLPRDPASDAALALALIMAEGDPDLADLAEGIAAEVAQAPVADLVTAGTATVQPGQSDSYQIVFNGQVPAEAAVIGESEGPFRLQIDSPDGKTLCRQTGGPAPTYCGFTPLQNDYFSVTVTNPGKDPLVYRLITN